MASSKKPTSKPAKKPVAKAAKTPAKAVAKKVMTPAKAPVPAATTSVAPVRKESCYSTTTCCCGFTSFCVCNTLRTMCPLFNTLSTLQFWVASLVAFVVVFLFQGFWHGGLLMADYIATAHMWRPTMDQNLFYVSQVLTAMVLVALVQLMGQRTWWGGIVTGVLASAPFTIGALMSYITMPFETGYIPAMWAVGDLLQGALVGLCVTIVFKSPLFATGCGCGPACACGPNCTCGCK